MAAGARAMFIAAIALAAAGPARGEPEVATAVAAVAAAAPARAQEPVAEDERWRSYRDFWFDYDSARIDPSDAGKVSDIAAYMKQNPTFRVGIDNAMEQGDSDLVARRIRTVRESLIKAGVPEYKIYTGAFGNPQLKRERRVEVLFSSGS